MSIAPPVGAMSAYLSRVISSHAYRSFRHVAKQLTRASAPAAAPMAAAQAEEYARGLATGGTLFEELGFYYIGPLDGHNLDHLLPVLKNVRDDERPRAGPDPRRDPEGQGLPAGRERRPTSTTAWSSSTSSPARSKKARSNAPSYTSVFAKALIKRGRDRRADRRDHRRDAVGHRPRPVRQALPGALLRRRHRRAARA